MEAVVEEAKLKNDSRQLDGLLPALKRLDTLLKRAVTAAQTAFGPEAAVECGTYRGR